MLRWLWKRPPKTPAQKEPDLFFQIVGTGIKSTTVNSNSTVTFKIHKTCTAQSVELVIGCRRVFIWKLHDVSLCNGDELNVSLQEFFDSLHTLKGLLG